MSWNGPKARFFFWLTANHSDEIGATTMANRAYSTLFSCLHDEAEPVGNLGNGTHHSVCRAVAWQDKDLSPLRKAKAHDFAIIWDEDHDDRVVPVVEGLLMAGLLAPTLFIGERKGNLTVVVDAALFDGTQINPDKYTEDVEHVCQVSTDADYWPVEVVALERTPEGLDGEGLGGLINDRSHRVLSYLRGIDVLWNLGLKEIGRKVPLD